MRISKPLVSPEVFRILNSDPDSIPADDAMLYHESSEYDEDRAQPVFGLGDSASTDRTGGGICAYLAWFYDGEDSDLTQ